ncbi:MAG: serine hydrolase domain-containing protein [Pseudomonadota bacterium]
MIISRLRLGRAPAVLTGVCAFVALWLGGVERAVAEERCERIPALFQKWDAEDSPGGAVAVVKDGRIACLYGFGSADLAHRVPNTPDTRFTSASISKAFTAYAVAKLVDDGEIDLDAPISSYLKDVSHTIGALTTRQLVAHTSGVRDELFLLRMAGRRRGDTVEREEVSRVLHAQEALNFPSGARWAYSNGGYALLANIVEAVTDTRFPDWTKEHIFERHGLGHTHFSGYGDVVLPNLARSYLPDETGAYHLRVLNDDDPGPTGLTTSVRDLAKWMLVLMDDKAELSGALEQFSTPAALSNGTPVKHFGFGHFLMNFRNVKGVGHGGRYSGHFNIYPEQNVGVAVLVNDASILPYQRLLRVADLFLDTSQQGKNDGFGVDQQTCGPAVDLPLAAGVYTTTPLRNIVNVRRRNGVPVFNWWGYETAIQACDGGYFAPGLAFEAFYTEGQTAKIRLGGLAIERRDPAVVSQEVYEKAVGRYYNSSLNTSYTLAMARGDFILRQDGQPDVVLFPLADDLFAATAPRFETLAFEADGDGRVSALLVSALNSQNVRFRRID